jgi:hypothetical protein
VLLALLWWLFSALLLFNAIVNPYNYNPPIGFIYYGDVSKPPNEVGQFSDDYRGIDEAVKRGLFREARITGFDWVRVFIPATAPNDLDKSRLADLSAKLSARQSVLRNASFWQAITSFAFAAAVPVVLLVLGAAVAWVLSGFRRGA